MIINRNIEISYIEPNTYTGTITKFTYDESKNYFWITIALNSLGKKLKLCEFANHQGIGQFLDEFTSDDCFNTDDLIGIHVTFTVATKVIGNKTYSSLLDISKEDDLDNN